LLGISLLAEQLLASLRTQLYEVMKGLGYECVDWSHLAQNVIQWHAVVDMAKGLEVL
jgi:hypothetical protein